jgi:hypothetical protein
MANLRANNVCGTDGRNAITGSVEIDGTGDYLSIPNTSDFRLGNSDFTIEGWAYLSAFGTNRTLFALFENATARRSYQLEVRSTGTVRFEWWYDGSTANNIDSASGIISLGSWNHYAVVRNGSTLTLYINGVSANSSNVGTNSFFENTTEPFLIGGNLQSAVFSQSWQGFVSNFRLIKGTALYTSNFIPPTRKLIRLPGTVLLCCQDNTSVTTEATGKTITANGNPAARRFVPQVGSDGGLVFDGTTKVNTQNYFYLPTGITEQRSRGRGLFGGGYIVSGPTNVNINTIEYVQIQSLSNAIDFGDLSVTRLYLGACSSSTRALFGGGYTQGTGSRNIIDYITIAATGNAIDFGDLQTGQHSRGSCSSSTRGIWASGTTNNQIDYVTIASTGNAQDFGDYGSGNRRDNSGVSSPTRGVFAGGFPALSDIEYITIASTGNSIDFGDLTNARFGPGGSSSAVRGIFAGGSAFPSLVGTNIIDYITIASTGNAIDFGDTTELNYRTAATSNGSRAVIAMSGGCSSPGPTTSNTYNYVTISTTGNAQDFGDASYICSGNRTDSGTSDSHGGIS